MNHFAKMYKKPQHKNQNRNKQNIENDNEIDEETVNNVENYNKRYEYDYSSSDDNCAAIISNDPSDKITPQIWKSLSEIVRSQVTFLLISGSLCSIVTNDLATLIINNCTEAKWASGKKRNKEFSNEPVRTLGSTNVNSTNRR